MTWSDGSHYKGDWKKGVPHGLGKTIFMKVPSKSKDKNHEWASMKTTSQFESSSIQIQKAYQKNNP